MPRYEDFKLIVDGSPGSYTIEAHGPFQISVPPEPFLLNWTDDLADSVKAMQNGDPVTRQQLEAVGSRLFEAVFRTRIYSAYSRARSMRHENFRLRLKLCIRPPELNQLPWELLYNNIDEKGFLALNLDSPISRYIETITPAASLLARRPLRILYVSSSPIDLPSLAISDSLETLKKSLGDRAEITTIHNAGLEDFQTALRQKIRYHVLHYDGHAYFDEDKKEGYLCFSDLAKKTQEVSGEMLSNYLSGSSIRLVVLAACQTASTSSQKRFSGIAHKLMVASSLPAVVAMQFPIEDQSAIAFARGFYSALIDQYPVDAALVEGRKVVQSSLGERAYTCPDWANPVLFMRSPDGDIFASNEMTEDALWEILNQFHEHHEKLNEWKDLHDHLDGILNSFNPFAKAIERADGQRIIPNRRSLLTLFNPVAQKVKFMLDWAAKIRYIGFPYQESPLGSIDGPDWAIRLAILSQEIQRHLGFTHQQVDEAPESAYPSSMESSLYRFLNIKNRWWNKLEQLSDEFEHEAYFYMHKADKSLREEAYKLYELSKQKLVLLRQETEQ
mgnify:CR=1 FL=1